MFATARTLPDSVFQLAYIEITSELRVCFYEYQQDYTVYQTQIVSHCDAWEGGQYLDLHIGKIRR